MKLFSLNHVWFFVLFLIFLSPNISYAKVKEGKFHSPLSIEIKVEKNTFRVGELVEGIILIKNTYPGSFPAIFDIKLFREDVLVSVIKTSMKRVPLGMTKFTFKEFGVPQFNGHAGAEAKWKIQIVQENVGEDNAAELDLLIVPPAIRKEDDKGLKIKKLF